MFSLGLGGCVGPQLQESAADEPVVGEAEEALESACPTASESAKLSRFWWKTSRHLEHVIWTDEGKEILGSEYLFEEKIPVFDPLSGSGVEQRKFCHRLFLANPDGTNRRDLGKAQSYYPGESFAFPRAGYVVIQKVHDQTWDYEWVALDGTRRPLGTISGNCTWGGAIPSPDGSIVAFTRTVQPGCDGTSSTATTTTVSFFDARGNSIGKSATMEKAGFARPTWTPAGQLIISDGQQASAVAVDGTVVTAPIPHCTEPPTTSSEVDAHGRVVKVVDDKIVILPELGTPFGCQ